MTPINRDDAWRVLRAATWYVANRSTDDFLDFFFDGVAHRAVADRPEGDPYVRGWAERFRHRNLVEIFSAMDYPNQRRFIAEVLRIYEQASLETLRAADRHRDLADVAKDVLMTPYRHGGLR